MKYKLLKEYYGYNSFRYPQDLIIDNILSHQNVIGLLPTGFGKSITYQIPSLILDGLTIVISPLIALMVDQVENLRKKGIEAEFLNSNVEYDKQQIIYYKIRTGKCKILYVSAERLQNEYFINQIKDINVSLITIDEAHTILWGEGFREAFIHIDKFINILKSNPVILALTATATDNTVMKIKHYLKLEDALVINSNPDRKNIFYKVNKTKDKKRELLAYLNFHKGKKGIIYCLTKKRVEELSKYLSDNKIKNVIYHGGLDVLTKDKNQMLFKDNECNVIVCTNAFGMGVDIPDIRFVICYDMPMNLEDLIQQIGRAARDGKYAEGIVYFDFKDLNTINYFIESSDVNENIKNQQRRKRDYLIDFCLSNKCRHQLLCQYFNEKIDKCRMYCDNCKRK